MMDLFVLAVFLLVYGGMILGEIPGLALDRSGIALLGAIAIVAGGRLSLKEAWLAIDISTIALLFGLMVVSAQFRLGGFYSEVVRRLAEHAAGCWIRSDAHRQPADHVDRPVAAALVC